MKGILPAHHSFVEVADHPLAGSELLLLAQVRRLLPQCSLRRHCLNLQLQTEGFEPVLEPSPSAKLAT